MFRQSPVHAYLDTLALNHRRKCAHYTYSLVRNMSNRPKKMWQAASLHTAAN
jgi:hypothetical protein